MSQPLIDRRTMLATGIAATGVAAAGPALARTPPDFLWGTAGAAYQIEGGNVASDVWVLEHLKSSPFRTPSGDADDVFNRIEEDLAFVAGLGFNAHRLSIEWSRIEPEQGQISYSGLAYYRGVLESCRRRGLAPVVTFNHTTVPRWFAARGGFETRDGIAPFVDFCRLVTQHMGDQIAVAATFNEPNVMAQVSWSPAVRPFLPLLRKAQKAAADATASPNWSSPALGDFRIQQPIMVEAHSRAYDAIKTASGDRFPIGVTLALGDDQPTETPAGMLAKRADILTPWLAAPGDMIGVQNYTHTKVAADGDLPPAPGEELTQMGYAYAPEALENVIRTVASLTKRPIYVTENGVATEDDTRRVEFIKRAVAGVMRCRADGLDVRSYLHWSLLDNWEWFNGYGPKFGLVSVDRTTFKRTPKPSAAYFSRLAKAGGRPI